MFQSPDGVYLRVRTPAPPPSTLARGSTTTGAGGDEFFRAVHGGIEELWQRPWHQHIIPWQGLPPHVALTLTGLPNLPIDLGINIFDPDPKRRHDLTMALRSVVLGQAQGAKVEVVTDPLLAALQPGITTIGWRLYTLNRGSEYPLRMIADIEGSDLLAPLATATQPRGTDLVEVQTIVQPLPRGRLNREWVGRAKALQIQLDAQADYSMSADSATLEAKIDSQPFYAWVRVVVLAHGPDAAQRITANLDQLQVVLRQYNEQTGHVTQALQCIGKGMALVKERDQEQVTRAFLRVPGWVPPPRLVLPVRIGPPARVMVARELGGLWHLPTFSMASVTRFLPCKYLPAPPHAFTNDEPDRIVFGYAHQADGTRAPVGPTLRDMRMPIHLTAGMGTGKSRLLSNLCIQFFPHGMILLDGKGDDTGNLVNTVRQHIPLADEHRLILIDMLDAEWPVGLNPLAGIDRDKPGGIDQALAQLLAIFARLDPDTWGKSQGMQQYLKQSALLVLEVEPHPTLAHVKQALVDDDYRAALLARCTNIDVKTFWEVIFPKTGEAQKTSRDALLRRFDALLSTEVTRYFMSQERPTVNLLDAIETGKMVLVPMPWVTYSSLAGTIGMIVFQAVVRSATQRPGDDQSRATMPMVIDEFQIFVGQGASEDVKAALTQLRAYGIAGIYAHQMLQQLGELESEMLGNTGGRVVLRTNEPDASAYATYYAASGLTAPDISGQDPLEHQYAAYTCRGKPTGLFSQDVLPWPTVVPLEVPAYTGPEWQTVMPPDTNDVELDALIAGMMYSATDHKDTVFVTSYAQASEPEWQRLRARWAAISAYQRQYIIDHPGCIAYDMTITDPDPDVCMRKRAAQQRFDRQRWLSRLAYATPLILAKIEYERIRTGLGSGGQRGDAANGAQTAQFKRITEADHGVPVTQPGAPEVDSNLLGTVEGAHGIPGHSIPQISKETIRPSTQVMHELAAQDAAERNRPLDGYELPEAGDVPQEGV